MRAARALKLAGCDRLAAFNAKCGVELLPQLLAFLVEGDRAHNCRVPARPEVGPVFVCRQLEECAAGEAPVVSLQRTAEAVVLRVKQQQRLAHSRWAVDERAVAVAKSKWHAAAAIRCRLDSQQILHLTGAQIVEVLDVLRC